MNLVELLDGELKEYSAKSIVANRLHQVDKEHLSKTMFKRILDCKKDDKVVIAKAFFYN